MVRRPIGTPRRATRAFTALEALIAAAILAFLTASVSGALMAGRAQSRLARDTLSSSFLARSLMDEIMRLPFEDPHGYTTMGPDAGESSRSAFNNIDDYSGYTDGPGNVAGNSPIADLAGNVYPDVYQGFKRTVSMQAVSSTPANWGRTLNGLLIDVRVSRDGQELIKLQRIAWH
jgi:type II secretory pathway pseudopilin PulG